MKELNVKTNLYLKLKQDESKEDAENRLMDLLNKINDSDFSYNNSWKSEIHEI